MISIHDNDSKFSVISMHIHLLDFRLLIRETKKHLFCLFSMFNIQESEPLYQDRDSSFFDLSGYF